MKYQLGVIGFGQMASAILEGAERKGVLKRAEVVVYDKEAAAWAAAGERYALAAGVAGAVRESAVVLLAVKPADCAVALKAARGAVKGDTAVVSVAAGIDKETIRRHLGGGAVARAMPNTPVTVGRGMTALDTSELPATGKAFVYKLFGALGDVLELPEHKMAAATAISGSGPAYFYAFCRALCRAGEQLGLTPAEARTLSVQTMAGAGALLSADLQAGAGVPPSADLQAAAVGRDTPNIDKVDGQVAAGGAPPSIDERIAAVCSRGGTTIEAMKVFERRDLDQTVAEAAAACHARAQELGRAKE